jgi:transcriptional regulator with XRE-family HTH domain
VPQEDNTDPALGQAIRERREELDMSQAALAEAAGSSQKYIWEIERTETNPSLAVLAAIAEALHMPAELLTMRAAVIRSDRRRQLGQAVRPRVRT